MNLDLSHNLPHNLQDSHDIHAWIDAWINAWTALTVLVLGDAMLDSDLNGSADRLCQEAPVPVVTLHDRRDAPGGAANTAANIASLGGRVVLLSVIGDDAEGDRLQQALQRQGVGTALLVSPQRATLAKQRIRAGSQLVARLDQGSTGAIAPELEQRLIEALMAQFARCDAVVISDYGYGVLTPRVIQTLRELQSSAPRPLAIDSRNLEHYREVGATAVKPNYAEAIRLLDLPQQRTERAAQIEPHAERLLDGTGATIAAVTLDAEGAILFQRGQPSLRLDARPVPHNQTSGAGDTFISALTLALTAGATTATAALLAMAATAVVVQRPETACCTAAALRQSWSALPDRHHQPHESERNIYA